MLDRLPDNLVRCVAGYTPRAFAAVSKRMLQLAVKAWVRLHLSERPSSWAHHRLVVIAGDIAGWTEAQWLLLARRLGLTRRRRVDGPLPTWRGAIRSHIARRCVGCGCRTVRSIDGHLICKTCTLSPLKKYWHMVTTGEARQMGWWRDFYARLYFMRHLVGDGL